jgi:NADPH:quinone reductase-like Zn-dependent oxidoreductase
MQRTGMMQAVICKEYGNPDVLELMELNKPQPGENEALVRIHATAATATDAIIRRLDVPGGHGFPVKQLMRLAMRVFIGFKRPRNPILGVVFSGVVEACGENMHLIREGDEIFGFTGQSRGAYAEYKCISEKEIKSGEVFLKPSNASHEEAAAIVYGGVLAIHFMEKAELCYGQKVLIYGASGAIGSMAVQLAHNRGAEVTAVCSSENFEWVRKLGADKMLNYREKASAHHLEEYDLVFDAAGKNKASAFKENCSKRLTKNGKSISVDDSLLKIHRDLLRQLKNLFEAEKIKAVIQKKYKLNDIVKAHECVDSGRKKGNIIIQVYP